MLVYNYYLNMFIHIYYNTLNITIIHNNLYIYSFNKYKILLTVMAVALTFVVKINQETRYIYNL